LPFDTRLMPGNDLCPVQTIGPLYLAALIEDVLGGRASADRLNDEVWEVIEVFTVTPKEQLPPVNHEKEGAC
jgi:hypothetical protein